MTEHDPDEPPEPVERSFTYEEEIERWSDGRFADQFLPPYTAAYMRLGQRAYERHRKAIEPPT